ncbi:hypothetical protein AVEN_254098-1 [Araneus ventricosus]|uniref:Uncharacterized protein n=1 Tax=Araneus ventricosus TaxID=182803 RepID=A0A4Y2BXW7_ARAVE|nr:hypothetical protein AVEN_254098-1 [Araneus ventricosus]
MISLLSLPSNISNIPRGATDTLFLEKRKWQNPEWERISHSSTQGDNPDDFTLPQPVCFPFRFSGSLPAARLLQLNQTRSVFTRIRTRLKGFSITSEKTNQTRGPALLNDN